MFVGFPLETLSLLKVLQRMVIQAKGVYSAYLHWNYACLVYIVFDNYMHQVSVPIVVGVLKPDLEWDVFLQKYVVMACDQNIS